MSIFTNLKFGITNLITYPGQDINSLKQAVNQLPIEKILLETDAPYFKPFNSPSPAHDSISGKIFSTPGNALNVAMKIADIKRTSLRQVLLNTTQNAQTLYALPV